MDPTIDDACKNFYNAYNLLIPDDFVEILLREPAILNDDEKTRLLSEISSNRRKEMLFLEILPAKGWGIFPKMETLMRSCRLIAAADEWRKFSQFPILPDTPFSDTDSTDGDRSVPVSPDDEPTTTSRIPIETPSLLDVVISSFVNITTAVGDYVIREADEREKDDRCAPCPISTQLSNEETNLNEKIISGAGPSSGGSKKRKTDDDS